ncbi:hypothetical protein BGP77_06605 [Saccharospirillum sp. MSK14-1]|uniref:glycine-rich domain-containing protein n=1 Tax=Saccharospirillum sp. MSK14-1 TaxID=1897632 RepID=UPI000D3731F9|nr:hypothetical protein [Saccharospirillum sp. MSK14-1]PTY36950.1 hypothetical protein BGP77_06605 [Saccharospirillum sp. MSK14-1]
MSNTANKLDPIINTSTLEHLLSYQNSDVLHKFLDEWDISLFEAKDIFDETKKFLWLAGKCKEECFHLEISESLLIIDKMWHAFILFTEEYGEFCETYFGAMLHHLPFSKENLKNQLIEMNKKGLDQDQAKAEHMQRQLEYVHQYLGFDTVKKWYIEYANRYSPQELNRIQKPAFQDINGNLGRPLTMEEVKGLGANEVIKLISLNAPIKCGWCGTNCGSYSSCNSDSSTQPSNPSCGAS